MNSKCKAVSSLHLQVLIANFSVFMVPTHKSLGLILQFCIFYNVFLYLECVALYFMHSSIFVYCIL